MAVPRLRRTALKNLEMAGLAGRERHHHRRVRFHRPPGRAFARFPNITRENVHEVDSLRGAGKLSSRRMRAGRGVLVATGHFGNWELSAFAHAYLTAPMHIVVRPIDNPRIDALVEHRRELSGNRAIAKKDAARGILRALAAGDAVGVLIDQNTTPDQGVFIDFFGVKACAGSAFVKLAQHSGAAVVPGYALWSEKERRYVLHFEPAVEMTGDVPAGHAACALRASKPPFASIPTSGCGFTGAGRRVRRGKGRFIDDDQTSLCILRIEPRNPSGVCCGCGRAGAKLSRARNYHRLRRR